MFSFAGPSSVLPGPGSSNPYFSLYVVAGWPLPGSVHGFPASCAVIFPATDVQRFFFVCDFSLRSGVLRFCSTLPLPPCFSFSVQSRILEKPLLSQPARLVPTPSRCHPPGHGNVPRTTKKPPPGLSLFLFKLSSRYTFTGQLLTAIIFRSIRAPLVSLSRLSEAFSVPISLF